MKSSKRKKVLMDYIVQVAQKRGQKVRLLKNKDGDIPYRIYSIK